MQQNLGVYMRKEKFDNIFNRTVESKNIHEAILLIENSQGDFHYSNTFGDKTIDSPILMASITKLYTTACIFILEEQKKLSLEDKISSYFEPDILKDLHVYKDNDFSNELTIIHLLTQTSGLPDIYENKNGLKDKMIEEDIFYSFDEWINNTKLSSPAFAPYFGNKAYYADINFNILGEIIEKVTDMPLHKAFEKYIFSTLELKHTSVPTIESTEIPYAYYNNQKLYRPKFLMSCGGSGSVVSTTKELMIFIKAFFKGTLFDAKRIYEDDVYRKLQLSMTPIRYGLGYMQIPLGGISTMFQGSGYLIGHSGSTGSFAFYHPSSELFFVGDLNQISKPSAPVRLSMQLSMSVKGTL